LKALKKSLKITINIILILIILFLLYANIVYYIFGQITLAIVKGNSMYPLLRDGDLVIVVPSKSIDLGDIIIYRNDREEFVIHRVIAILHCGNNPLYITKGDNNYFIDSLSIVYRKSIECPNAVKTVINATNSEYRDYIIQLLYNVERGINNDRIEGKALSIGKTIIKITGLWIHS